MGVCLNFKVFGNCVVQIPYKITIRIYPQTESKPFCLDQSAYALGHIYFVHLKGEVQWRGEQPWGIVSGSERSDGGVKSFRVAIHKTHIQNHLRKSCYIV